MVADKIDLCNLIDRIIMGMASKSKHYLYCFR